MERWTVSFVAFLVVIWRVDHVYGFCEVFNKQPVVRACQDDTATGPLVYIDSNGAPQDRIVNCPCEFTHNEGTEPYKVFVATIWNNELGVEFEIGGVTFTRNSDQPAVNLTTGSQIMFKKKNLNDRAKVCNGLSAAPGFGNFTVTCTSNIIYPPSTDAPQLTTPTPAPTTPTPAPTTPTPAPTTQTPAPTQPPRTTPKPATTKAPITTKAPATTPEPPATTKKPPTTTYKLTVTTSKGTTAQPGGRDMVEDDDDVDALDILIIVFLALGVLLVILVFLCAMRKKPEKKTEKEQIYRDSVQPYEPDYYMTDNPTYAPSDVYQPGTFVNEAPVGYILPPAEHVSSGFTLVSMNRSGSDHSTTHVQGNTVVVTQGYGEENGIPNYDGYRVTENELNSGEIEVETIPTYAAVVRKAPDDITIQSTSFSGGFRPYVVEDTDETVDVKPEPDAPVTYVKSESDYENPVVDDEGYTALDKTDIGRREDTAETEIVHVLATEEKEVNY